MTDTEALIEYIAVRLPGPTCGPDEVWVSDVHVILLRDNKLNFNYCHTCTINLKVLDLADPNDDIDGFINNVKVEIARFRLCIKCLEQILSRNKIAAPWYLDRTLACFARHDAYTSDDMRKFLLERYNVDPCVKSETV